MSSSSDAKAKILANLAAKGYTKSVANIEAANKAKANPTAVQGPANYTSGTTLIKPTSYVGSTASPSQLASTSKAVQGPVNYTSGTTLTKPASYVGSDPNLDQLRALSGANAVVPKKEVIAPPPPPPPEDTFKGTPEYTTPTDPFQAQLLEALQKLMNIPAFNPDIENDPAYQASAKAAANVAKQQMASIGRLYSGATDTRMQQAALAQALPFRQQAYQEYQGQNNLLANQLSTLNSLGQQGIQNQRTDYDYATKSVQNQNVGAESKFDFNAKVEDRNLRLADDQDARDVAEFGFKLPPQARQAMTVFQSMPSQVRAQVDQYQGNYAAEINRREAANPSDPLLPYLYAARAAKIVADPSLMAKYGDDLGIASPVITEMAMKYEMQLLKNEIDKLAASYANETAKVELAKLYAQLDKAVSDADAAAQTAFMKQLEATNLPNKIKQELAIGSAEIFYKYSQANAQNTAAQENIANIGLIEERAKTEKVTQGKIANQAAAVGAKLEGDKDNFASRMYSNFVNSGKNLDAWLATPLKDANGKEMAKNISTTLSKDELAYIIDNAKKQGKFTSSGVSSKDILAELKK